MLQLYNTYTKVIKFTELPDPTETWELQDLIGEGTYGDVYTGRHKVTGIYMYLPFCLRIVVSNTYCVFCFVCLHLVFCLPNVSLCLKFFSPTCPKAKFRKIVYLFKQILSYSSLFMNPALLVPGFRQVG